MSAELTLAPNPFGAEHLEDPYPLLAQLRDGCAIQRAEHHGGVESWLVLGFEEVRTALKDARLSTDPRHAPELFRRAGLLLGDADEPASLLTSDPPDHTRLRKLVAGAFTPRRAEQRRTEIEQVVEELLDDIAPRGRADLVAEFAFPLPIIVITRLLGVPTGDRESFRHWTHEMQTPPSVPDAPARKRAAQRAMHAYLEALIAERRAWLASGPPGEDHDFGTALIHAADERAVSEGELIALFFELLIGGYETVANFLANAVHALLTHPAQRAYLQRHPERMPDAVEELLRFDGSVLRAVPRVAVADVELAGTRIPKGSLVTIVLGAGNRDPRAFERPAELDVARPARKHLSFGHGIHFCPGAGLARVEAEVGLSRLLLRLPDLAADGEARHRAAGVMRALHALPVRFTPNPRSQPKGDTMTELAPAAGRDTAAIGTLTTTIIECADLARTLPFYTEQLGLEVLSQGESFTVLATGSASIVLWQGAKTDVVIAFTGADLDQARSLLESRGAEVGPNGTHPTGEHFYVTDPEGNDIMIST